MTPKDLRLIRGQFDLDYNPKVTGSLKVAVIYFMTPKVKVAFVIYLTFFMTPKGHRVIIGCRDLQHDPKGQADL